MTTYYSFRETRPPERGNSTEHILQTVAYRTWDDWENVAIGNSNKRVPDTFHTDFNSPNVYTTWEAIREFWNKLEPVTIPYREYGGFAGSGDTSGSDLMCRFFAEHEEFKCHIEQRNGRKALVKDGGGGERMSGHVIKKNFKVGEHVECCKPNQYPIEGKILELDTHPFAYDALKIETDNLMHTLVLWVSERDCIRKAAGVI